MTPEPVSFNGGPDEGQARTTGRRRDEPAASDPRGMPCHTCGLPIHRVYSLADVGVFCSPKCRAKKTVPASEVA